MIDLMQAIPFEKWGPTTGVINQCHDSITVECPESEAQWVKGVLTEVMNRHVYPYRVKFTSDADIGKRWIDT